MLTRVIEVLIDVVVERLIILLNESSLSFLLADLINLLGNIIINLERLLDHETFLFL